MPSSSLVKLSYFKLSYWIKIYISMGGWEEKWRLKLTSAIVEVEVEADLGNIHTTLLILQVYSSWVTFLSLYWCSLLVWTGGWLGGWVALEESKLRLTSAKVEVETELGKKLGVGEQGEKTKAKKIENNDINKIFASEPPHW